MQHGVAVEGAGRSADLDAVGRRRHAHGVAATVVGDAGYLAGVLDVARTGVGVALLAEIGPAPDGLSPYDGLPSVTPIPMSALARPSADPATVAAAFEAVRDLLRPAR